MSSKIVLAVVCIAALSVNMTFATFGKKGSPVVVPLVGQPSYVMPVQYAQLYGPVHQQQGLFSKFGTKGSHNGGYLAAPSYYPSQYNYGGYNKPHCC